MVTFTNRSEPWGGHPLLQMLIYVFKHSNMLLVMHTAVSFPQEYYIKINLSFLKGPSSLPDYLFDLSIDAEIICGPVFRFRDRRASLSLILILKHELLCHFMSFESNEMLVSFF